MEETQNGMAHNPDIGGKWNFSRRRLKKFKVLTLYTLEHYLLDRENGIILLLSLLASIILTLVSYPGYMYSDSYVRWNLVNEFVHGGELYGDNWHSHIPTIAMYLPYAVTGNYASFTVLQSFLFFFTSLHLVKQTRTNASTTIVFAILFVSFPLFAVYSVYHAPDVLAVIGINIFLITFFQRANRSIGGFRCLSLFSISLVIILGCRPNALTLIPVFLLCFYVLYKEHKQRLFFASQIVVLVLSFLVVASVPHLLNIYKYDVSAIGCSWEIVSILRTMKENDLPTYERYRHYLDYAGDTEYAVDHNIDDNIWGMHSDVFDLKKAGKLANANRLKQDYLSLAKNEPKYFIRNKWEFVRRTMGIHYRLGNHFRLENDAAKRFYGIVDTKQRERLYDSLIRLFKSDLLSKPYRMFVSTLFLIAAVGVLMRKRMRLFPYWLMWLFAVFYYLGFLISTQSHEVRYYFPSLYLLLLGGATLVIDVFLYGIKNRLRAIGRRSRVAWRLVG